MSVEMDLRRIFFGRLLESRGPFEFMGRSDPDFESVFDHQDRRRGHEALVAQGSERCGERASFPGLTRIHRPLPRASTIASII
jgi:hypothetical protein